MHMESCDKSLSLNFRFIIGYPPYHGDRNNLARIIGAAEFQAFFN